MGCLDLTLAYKIHILSPITVWEMNRLCLSCKGQKNIIMSCFDFLYISQYFGTHFAYSSQYKKTFAVTVMLLHHISITCYYLRDVYIIFRQCLFQSYFSLLLLPVFQSGNGWYLLLKIPFLFTPWVA